MQNNTAKVLWLILAGTVATIEAVPDSTARSHHEIHPLPPGSPPKPTFLEKAFSLKHGVGKGASKLTSTLRTKRRNSSPEKKVETPLVAETLPVVERSDVSPIPTVKVWTCGEFYANLPPGSPPKESDYLKLSDLKPLIATNVCSNTPNDAQDDIAIELRHALNLGETETARRLIEKGGDPNTQSENNGTTLLQISTQRGNENVARWLLEEKRADATIANHSGRTALHQAALFGRTVIAGLLVEAGGDIDAVEKTTGFTPLEFAQKRNHAALVDMLLAAKTKRATLELRE